MCFGDKFRSQFGQGSLEQVKGRLINGFLWEFIPEADR